MAKPEHTANLANHDAIEKMKHIAHGETGMFCTFRAVQVAPMATRPMATSAIDEDGTFWFMSRASSSKNREIVANPNVQLVYAIGARSEYLTLEGHATITRDAAQIEKVWTPIAKTWFPEGKEDPELTLIAVKPTRGYYWDTKHSKMVALAGMAIGALTGKELDDSLEGTLKV